MARDPAVTVGIGGDASGVNSAVSSAVASVGRLKTAVAGAGVAVAGLGAVLGGAAVNSAADFESAMVEVEKVTSPETAREMRDEVMSMAESMPVAQDNLAGIAAQAGRFGVEGPENIRQFTESVAQMAVATDLTEQQAGEAFARMTTLMDEPIDNIQNLGDAVNGLSNNMATSASEITNASTRSSGALSQLGLQSEEILALNASMNEVSASSRIAGTRLRRFAQELQDPGKTEDLAAALGMTADEFRAMREESPNEVMRQMVATFGEGGDAADQLRTTLSTTSRQALAGLAQNTESWTDAQETANRQMGEGTSLQEEYDAAADTFNNKLQILRNRLNNVAIAIGEDLLPAASDLVETLNEGLGALEGWIEGSEDGAESMGKLGEAIGGVQAAGEEAMQGLRDVFNRHLGGIVRRVQGVLRSMRRFWDRHGAQIERVVRSAWNIITAVIEGALDSVLTMVNTALAILRGDWSAAWTLITGLISRQLQRIATIFRNSVSLLGDAAGLAIGAIADAFEHLIDIVIVNDDSLIKSLIRNVASWIRETATGILSGAFGVLTGAVETALDWLIGTGDGTLLGDVKGAIEAVASWISDGAVSDVTDAVTSLFGGMGDAAWGAFQTAWNETLGQVSISIPEIDLGPAGTYGGGSIGLPQLDTGGLIEEDGLYVGHAGERVLPEAQVTDRGEAAVEGGGAGPDEIASAIERADRTDAVVRELRRVQDGLEIVAEEAGADVEFRDSDRWNAVRR